MYKSMRVGSISNFLRISVFLTLVLVMSSVAQAQYEEQEAANSRFYYSGYAGSEKIEFNLQIDGLLVYGSYIVKSTGHLYIFRGRLSSDRTGLGVLIFDEKDQYVASLEAKLISEEYSFAREIKGKLKYADGKKTTLIAVTKTGELASMSMPVRMQTVCMR